MSFFIQIVFILKSSSFSCLPGWRVFLGGDNSKAPLLPAEAIKLHSDAQAGKAAVLWHAAVAPELWADVPELPLHGSRRVGDGACTGYTLLCNWDRARLWILELDSVPGSHSLDVLRFPNEPKDKYLSRTEVYIKYVLHKGPDWFCYKSVFSPVTVNCEITSSETE